jgi:hypothetical protein
VPPRAEALGGAQPSWRPLGSVGPKSSRVASVTFRCPIGRSRSRTTLDAEAPPVLSVGNAGVPCGEGTVHPHAFRVNRFVDNPQVVPRVCGLSPAPSRFSTARCTLHPQGASRSIPPTSQLDRRAFTAPGPTPTLSG